MLKLRTRKIRLNFDKEKPEKYVASHVLVGSISLEKLCNEVNQRSGVHRGMVDLVIKALVDTAASYIEEGFSVKFGEFGSFRPAVHAKSVNKADDVKAATVKQKRIVFTPGARFKAMLENTGLELIDNEFESDSADHRPGGDGTQTGGDNPKTDGGDSKPDGGDSKPDGHGEAPDPAGGLE